MPTNARRRRRKRRERVPEPSRPVAVPRPIPRSYVLKEWLSINLISVGFCVAAWAALTYGFDERTLAHDSVIWPTATGVVIRAAAVRGSRYGNFYEPYGAYSYTVDGRTYESSNGPLRSGGYGSRETTVEYLNQHGVGSKVEVWYEPDDPGRSVLEPGGGEDWAIFVVSGAAAAIVGVVVLVWTTSVAVRNLRWVNAERKQVTALNKAT